MAQIAWNVRGNRGNRFQIGLFHGDQDGHVVLHCNGKVVQIDFSVQASKDYKLMLDEELCVISIQREADGSYAYSCELDKDTETPLNLNRKATAELAAKNENQRFMMFAGVVIICLIGWLVLG
ncbi:MAG: hypothetical protein AAF828_05190 [Bacteroidota bacterium]